MKFKLMPYIYSKKEYYFIEFNLKDLEGNLENPYAITFGEYSDKDLNPLDYTLKIIEKEWKPFTIDEVGKRLGSGHKLFLAKKNGRIIGFFWVATNYIEVLYFHASIHLSKDEIYDYNNYVVEDYRSKNINKCLKSYAFYYLREKGYNKAFSYIETTNQRSLRANEKLGYRTLGKTVGIRIMTLEFRYHNFPTEKIVFHGGPLRLWRVLFRKVKEIIIHKTAISDNLRS